MFRPVSFHDEFEEVGGVSGDDFDEVGGGGESGDVEAVGTPEVQQCLSERRDDLYLFYIAGGVPERLSTTVTELVAGLGVS